MSEQAEAKNPTAHEETATEDQPSQPPTDTGAREAAASPGETTASSQPEPDGSRAEESPEAGGESSAAAQDETEAPEMATPETATPETATPESVTPASAAEQQELKEGSQEEAAERTETTESAAAAAATPKEEASPESEPDSAEAPGSDALQAEAVAPAEADAQPGEAAEAEEAPAVTTGDEAPKAEAEQKAEDDEGAVTAEAEAKTEETEETRGKTAERAAAAEDAEGGKEEKEEEEEELTEEELQRRAEVEKLRKAKEEGMPVEGRVIGWNQGGFHVVVDSITTFCPRSEMELKNPKSPNYYVDKTFEFYVIKHQKKGKRIVLSRKALLEEERAKILEEMEDKLKAGEDITGRVSSITDFGAFVDIGGGIEGLVHVTELSNLRVKHPRDVVELGQEVKVRVLKVEEGGDRISLSMKALEPNPYAEFAEDHPRGSKFKGKIVRKTDFGMFVELKPGLDGMVHTSQLPPGMTLEADSLEVGKQIEGWVIRTEPGRERISLSLKEVPSEDPWKNVQEKYAEGSVVEGQVEDVAPFGVFIQLEPGLTGLLPNSEMDLPRGQDRSRHYPPGKKVEIQVASVDPKRKRISLVPQGAKIEGSRADYKNYLQEQRQEEESSGMTAMAAAFAKLQEGGDGD